MLKALIVTGLGLIAAIGAAFAQGEPTITIPGLEVRTVVSGLQKPTSMAFLGPDDFFVLEKDTGKVLRYRNGLRSEVLDLAVNNASERGLLGIALHPRFDSDRGVYLFWTCRTAAPRSAAVREPETCDTSRITGEDTSDILSVPLLGNRVDRFTWDGSTLTFDRNVIMLRSLQADGVPDPPGQSDVNQPARGNHDGGVIAFGPDQKLYVFFGDQGRRGWLQNLRNGPPPLTDPNRDDQFGGPQPDNAHFSGVILRLNADGTTPEDNPFFAEGARMGGEVGTNIQKVFAYGLRNSFGMNFDPFSGALWISEHGDDTFDEINLVHRGMNGGWVQVAGPLSRIEEFRGIETTFFAAPETFPSLQQWRWPPNLIADSAAAAASRMFVLPGALYLDPQFSWRWATLPVALGFAPRNFGRDVAGSLLVTVAGNPITAVGYLVQFPVHPSRRALEMPNSSLGDRVADNSAKYDLTETEPLIVGQGYGIATDFKTSPRNTIYVVSNSNGAIYEISRSGQSDNADDNGQDDESGLGNALTATLAGADQDASGNASIRLHSGRELICFDISVLNLDVPATVSIFQGSPRAGTFVMDLTTMGGTQSTGCTPASRDVIRAMRNSVHFINVRNATFPESALSGSLL